MKIRFWGVRGSIPSPGAHTVRYGGNTMCLSVALDDGHTLILDAGSGLFRLGQKASKAKHVYFFLLSHVHWDHINGFPMFYPHMNPAVSIRLFTEMNPDWEKAFFCQLDGDHFPITREEMRADVSAEPSINTALSAFGLTVSRIRLNHRGPCFGYRISSETGTFVYVTDHEIDATESVHLSFDELVSFCKDADILIHDAQYTTDDLAVKAGWGHSCAERACDVAVAAGVGRLIFCHHDPDRSDDEIDLLVETANARLETLGVNFECEGAFEGLEIDF